VKNGWFFVMADDHDGFRCVKSRVGDLLIPHGEEARSAVSNHAGPTVASILRDALRAPQDEGLAVVPLPTRHSASTASSVSAPTDFAASESNLSRFTSCDSAQTAAPRTSGLPSPSNRSAAGASDASSALPIAISTLRTKRSRPIRFDRRFRKQRAERGVVEPRQLGKRRRLQFRTCGQLCFAAFLRKFVPRAHGETIVAAIDAIADALCGIRAE
jgi:hypothetical protein